MEANGHGCQKLDTEDWGKVAHVGVCRTIGAKSEHMGDFFDGIKVRAGCRKMTVIGDNKG